jgi:hypothetical protein
MDPPLAPHPEGRGRKRVRFDDNSTINPNQNEDSHHTGLQHDSAQAVSHQNHRSPNETQEALHLAPGQPLASEGAQNSIAHGQPMASVEAPTSTAPGTSWTSEGAQPLIGHGQALAPVDELINIAPGQPFSSEGAPQSTANAISSERVDKTIPDPSTLPSKGFSNHPSLHYSSSTAHRPQYRICMDPWNSNIPKDSVA